MGKTATMELIDFIARSPSSFHAVDQVRQALEAAGYRRLEESEPWSITPGERCYVTRNASSLIAFQVPRGPWKGFLLSASHSDSPTFQIKENGDLEGPEQVRSQDGHGAALWHRGAQGGIPGPGGPGRRCGGGRPVGDGSVPVPAAAGDNLGGRGGVCLRAPAG